jgi:magnesium-transporting ATPase (P-type)
MARENPYLAPQSSLTPNTLPSASLGSYDDRSREKIFAVAKYQRWINLEFLLMIAVIFIGGNLVGLNKEQPQGAPEAHSTGKVLFALLFWAAYLPIMYPVNKLAHLLRKENPALMTFGVITFVGLIIVFIYNNRVTKYLQQFGIKVGFLGASRASIAAQLDGRT